MNVESRTIRPRPTGSVEGRWHECYGEQRVQVRVDPGRPRDDSEFRVLLERRWGPQLGDLRNEDFRLSRVGVETLRDALIAALDWRADA